MMDLQDLEPENGMLLTIKITQNMMKEIKMIQPLNLKQMLLKQIFATIQMNIFVTGDITAKRGDANTKVAFKMCAPFTRCITHINDEHVDSAKNLDIIIPVYN